MNLTLITETYSQRLLLACSLEEDLQSHEAALSNLHKILEKCLATMNRREPGSSSTELPRTPPGNSTLSQQSYPPSTSCPHLSSNTRDSGRQRSTARASSVMPELDSTHINARGEANYNDKRVGPDQIVNNKLPLVTKLIAVYPFTQLTESESRVSVLEVFLGIRFAAWWIKHSRGRGDVVRLWVATFLAWGCALSGNFGIQPSSLLYPALRAFLLVTYSCAFSYLTFSFSSKLNWHLVKRCFFFIDTYLMVMDAFVFSGGYFLLLDCTLFSFCGALGTFVGYVIIIILYDAFPIEDRVQLRYVKIFLGIGFYALVFLMFCEISPTNTPYRFYLSKGLVADVESSDGASTMSQNSLASNASYEDCSSTSPGHTATAGGGALNILSMSVSVKEFCLNRGYNLCIVVLKMTYASFKHPNDCLIIKSRVRTVVETQEEEEHKTPQNNVVRK